VQIPEGTIRRACEVLGDSQAEDEATRDLATRLLLAVIPSIRAYERERIAEIISPARLELLAQWLDEQDKQLGVRSSPEVQRDLRLWARLLRDAPGPASVSEMLMDAAGDLGLVGP
jgi:hypothetical protein